MKRKTLLILLPFLFIIFSTKAQVTGTFTIGGDIDKYYPVTFHDQAWFSNVATVLQIGRSDVHRDGQWRGSIIATFTFHITAWGNGSNFIDANIRQASGFAPANLLDFVGGWRDLTQGSQVHAIMIWLRGNTSYTYTANQAVSPAVYDGSQNALPYLEPNGPQHTFKTTADTYVNRNGLSYDHPFYVNHGGTNYMNGKLGIGTINTGDYKLAVEGTIGARKVKVTSAPWADFVFEKDYKLPTLKELEDFIAANKHLPGIPTATEVGQHGVELGDISAKLLQKIEEQALYIIELNKKREEQTSQIAALNKKLEALSKRLEQLEK